MTKLFYIFIFFILFNPIYGQTIITAVDWYFKMSGWSYGSAFIENPDSKEIHSQKVKIRKIFYHHITSNEVDKEYLNEISEFDTLGNELNRTNFYDSEDISSKKIKKYDSKGNLIQLTTNNYCSPYALPNSCRMALYYEEYFYYNNSNKIIKREMYYPNKDSAFNKDSRKSSSFEIYKYDSLNRPFEYIAFSNFDTIEHYAYYYNKKGNLIREKNWKYNHETIIKYNSDGKPIESITKPNGYIIKCKYDSTGNLLELVCMNKKKEMQIKYNYSYSYDEYSSKISTWEDYLTNDKKNTRETFREYNAEKKLITTREENDKKQIINQIINKYKKNGLPLEKYEYLSKGSAIRLIRYEYEFH